MGDKESRAHAPTGRKNAFPPAGIDGFLSHFIFTIQFNKGELKGQIHSYTWPAAIQTVVRSQPFVYDSQGENFAEFPLPKGCDLPSSMSEGDFLTVPDGFFEDGKETIFLQILNLDARGDTRFGQLRCILGETFKREYPDVFQPSFGATQSLGKRGLPARLFFSPNGIFETPIGALRTRPKALLGEEIHSIPPVGSNPSLLAAVPLDSVEDLRANNGSSEGLEEFATVLALAHPIDALLHGKDLFNKVERAIAQPA